MQQNVEYVGKLRYLDIELHVKRRTSGINFQPLRPIMVNLNIELRLYTSTVILISTATYTCEPWKITAIDAYSLDVCQQCCLRATFGISWRDHAINEEVMRVADIKRLQDVIITRRREMAGHILRLQRERPAHTAMGARRRQNKEGGCQMRHGGVHLKILRCEHTWIKLITRSQEKRCGIA